MPPTFNPGLAKWRVAHSQNGLLPLPGSAGWMDFEFISSQAGNTAERVENPSIRGTGQASESLPGITATEGTFEALVNAEATVYFYANAQKRFTTTSPDTDVYLHVLAPSADDPAAPELAMIGSRDDGLPQKFVGGKVSELSWTWEKGGLLTCTHTVIFEGADYWDSAIVVTDPGATAPPQVRRLQSSTHLLTPGDDIFVKVVSVASGVVTYLAKITAAAAYGVITSSVTIGNNADGEPIWGEILDSTTGLNYGTRAVHPQIHFPSATALVADDSWRFNRERTMWTPAIPDVLPFNSIYAAILLDDAEVCIDSFELTLTLPVEAQTCLGNAFGHMIRERGNRLVELSIDREYLDIKHRARLETFQPFGFKVHAYTGVAFEPGHEHSFALICPRLIASGETADVNDPNIMSETIEAQAFPDPTNGDGYVDDLTIEVVNSMANVATVV